MTSLKRLFSSSILLIILSASKKLVGLVSTLILARILTPEDFGLVAIATLAYGLVEVVSVTGSEQYVITSKEVSKDTLNTAFTYNIFLKTLIAIVFFISSPFLAAFFNDERLIPIFMVLAVMLLISGATNPQVYLLKKNQNYGKLVKNIIVVKFIATAAAIITAIITRSYWALIVGQFIAYTGPVIGSYVIAPYKPSLNFKNLKNQFNFSGWLLPSSVFGYFRSQIDMIFVSKIFDATSVGAYHVMKYLTFIPSQHLVTPMTEPLLAQLSNIKENKTYFIQMFNVSLLITLFISAPICQLLFSHSEFIINFVLGEKWVQYANLLKIFSIATLMLAIYNQSNNCFLIYKKTKLIFIFETSFFLTICILFYLYQFIEVDDLAKLKLIIDSISAVLIFLLASIILMSLRNFIKITSLSLSIFTISFLSVTIASNVTTSIENQFFNFILWSFIYLSLFAIITITSCFILRKHVYELHYLSSKLIKLLNRKINEIKKT